MNPVKFWREQTSIIPRKFTQWVEFEPCPLLVGKVGVTEFQTWDREDHVIVWRRIRMIIVHSLSGTSEGRIFHHIVFQSSYLKQDHPMVWH